MGDVPIGDPQVRCQVGASNGPQGFDPFDILRVREHLQAPPLGFGGPGRSARYDYRGAVLYGEHGELRGDAPPPVRAHPVILRPGDSPFVQEVEDVASGYAEDKPDVGG